MAKQSTYYTHEVIAEHMAVKQDNLRSREVRKSTLYSLLLNKCVKKNTIIHK